MPSKLVTKPTAVGASFGYAFLDMYGDTKSNAPVHASLNSSGALINPATDDTLQALISIFSSPLPVTWTSQAVAISSLPLPPNAAQNDTLANVLAALDQLISTVSAATLPNGAATSSAQQSTLTALQQLHTDLVANPLPTNAATDASLQTILSAIKSTLTIGLPVGAASDASVQAIATALGLVLKTAPQANAPRVSTTGPLAAAYIAANSLAANITAGAALTLAVDGMSTAIMQITGTWAGTIALMGSVDGGATYLPINMTPFGAGLSGQSTALTTVNGQFEVAVGALTHVQAQMTAFTSGSAAVLLAASNGVKIARVKAPASDPLPDLDANNAPFSTATPLPASGATPARSVGVVASAAGNIALTLSGSGSITLPVGIGWQTFPFAATGAVLSGGAAGSVYNLS